MYKNLGDRRISLVKELTKIHEEVLAGNISEIIDVLNKKEPKGEYVVLLHGVENKLDFERLSVDEHINFYIKSGYDLNESIKKVAKERGVRKNEIYSLVHNINNKDRRE